MMHVKAVAILEVMWGGVESPNSPGFFRINPNNFSGRRLYGLLGHKSLLVTNACPQCVSHAAGRGTPGPVRLAANLRRLRYDLLLVCGRVAQTTYAQCGYTPPKGTDVIPMKHPAARTWSRDELANMQAMLSQYV